MLGKRAREGVSEGRGLHCAVTGVILMEKYNNTVRRLYVPVAS